MKLKYGVIGIGALLIGIFLYALFQTLTFDPTTADDTAALPEGISSRVTVSDNIVTVKTAKEVTRKYVPTSGSVNVDIKADGTSNVRIKGHGFTFKPEMGLLIQNNVYVHGSASFYYFNRFSLLAGVAGNKDNVMGHVGISYTLDRLKLRNTAVFVSYTTDSRVAVGVSVRL